MLQTVLPVQTDTHGFRPKIWDDPCNLKRENDVKSMINRKLI
jgi:hypothetical protein